MSEPTLKEKVAYAIRKNIMCRELKLRALQVGFVYEVTGIEEATSDIMKLIEGDYQFEHPPKEAQNAL